MRIRQEKSRGAGEPKGERCLSGGRAKLWVRKRSAHPSTAPEGYPTAVARSWTHRRHQRNPGTVASTRRAISQT
eukprot:1267793-Prymnesium_polylepis.1